MRGPRLRPAGVAGSGAPRAGRLTALPLRMVFHLPLRQPEGFVASWLRLMGLDLNAPDHTTLSRRNRDVLVPAVRRADDGAIHLVVDSTGLKIDGAGEWCSRKHRQAHERSGWRKLHIGVDDNGYVVAETLTQNTGDGAYDTRSVYTAVGEAGGTGVEIVVPPRRPAAASPTSTPDRSVVEPCNKATAWSEG